MAVIHRTTMSPSKLELLSRWLPEQAWYSGRGVTLSGFGYDALTRPKSFHLRTEL